MAKFYAVKDGRKVGIFETWDECKDSVSGYKGAIYKSFKTRDEALSYLNGEEIVSPNGDLTSMESIDESIPYAFVDGSFNPETNVYGCGGFLVIGDEKIPIQDSANDEEMATMRNVSGEILGATLAIKQAISEGIKKLVIYYDYEGIKQWAEGTWKRNKKGTKEYYEFIQSTKDKISLKFVHVKGHTGIEGNETADKLAKEAVGVK